MLCRVLVQVADSFGRLSDQAERLRGLEPFVVFDYLHGSFMVLALSTGLVPEAELQPAEEQHLCSCARLVLTSGTSAALQGIAQLQQGVPCDPQRNGLLLWSGQLALEFGVQRALSAGCLQWFVTNAATPALLASWLAAIVTGLEQLSQQSAQPSEISCVPACVEGARSLTFANPRFVQAPRFAQPWLLCAM